MKNDNVILGIDLGTSAIKCVAMSVSGKVMATTEAAFPVTRELPGQAEQNPLDWLAALEAAIKQLDADVAKQVSSIGLTGQLPTLVCLQGDRPLPSAITWMDSRADTWASGVLDEPKRQMIYERTGMPIDGRYLAPMFRHHLDCFGKSVTAILSAKDFLHFALTGELTTDPSTAAGYGLYDLDSKSWAPELCAVWGVEKALLPAIRQAEATSPLGGNVATRLGLPAGVPVAVGCADSVASVYAMAGLGSGTVCVTTGSSTIIMDSLRDPLRDPRRRYLLTPHAVDGVFGREMDLLSTGTSYRWLNDLLGWDNGRIDAAAAASQAGANGLMFSPYLAGGEQGALWNPNLRGVLHGLTVQHKAQDIARAYLEGVQFEIRRCIDILAETSKIERVVLAGHAVSHVSTRQMLADILGRPVVSYHHSSPAAVGAALLAVPQSERPAPTASQTDVVAPSAISSNYEKIYRRYSALFPAIAEASD
ncbi:MAG TPA: FGGY-family carbohydrate kinase [Mesorhizobium sp.]|jgi:sugar (pentulose or hexulose) kinase|uniref:xylulokinase n=1 Tax=Mesorhizobium sp. TaxID=1871066 RepID=UPI002DDD24C7|nr:FGGY-family carbohydrate kinase [Mesorhizobium sp.]HEV2501745.1 FGGY-family carbohydrate kinase [Mesorhizobium sp.]